LRQPVFNLDRHLTDLVELTALRPPNQISELCPAYTSPPAEIIGQDHLLAWRCFRVEAELRTTVVGMAVQHCQNNWPFPFLLRHKELPSSQNTWIILRMYFDLSRSKRRMIPSLTHENIFLLSTA